MKTVPRDDTRLRRFAENMRNLLPQEAADCFKGGALVGGCVVIASALDVASSAAQGLRHDDRTGRIREKALRSFVRDYFPSPYSKVNWYTQFRNPLVHNFCPRGLEMVHRDHLRQKHLRPIKVNGRDYTCVHVIQLCDDFIAAMKSFADAIEQDRDLAKCVRQYIGNHHVLDPRDIE
jgi:hypothetical protein